jgi:uncharacterized protein HemY
MRRAVELVPNHTYWLTIGVVHYRNRNWHEAITALETAIAKKTAYIPVAQFFLAMTYWQLGDKEQARRLYEQAAAETDRHGTTGEYQLRYCRAEAAALLGRNNGAGFPLPARPPSQP